MTVTDAEKLAAIAERLARYDDPDGTKWDHDANLFVEDVEKIVES